MPKMIPKANKAHCQSAFHHHKKILSGRASINAVISAICRGVMVGLERDMEWGAAYAITKIVRDGRLLLKFVPHPLNGSDAVNAQLLSNLSDMDIDGAIAYDHFVAPHLVEDLVAQENPTRAMRQQVQQFKFLFGQCDLVTINSYGKLLGVDADGIHGQYPGLGFTETPEQCIDPRYQYFGADGFSNIIIRSGLQSFYVRAIIVKGCEH